MTALQETVANAIYAASGDGVPGMANAYKSCLQTYIEEQSVSEPPPADPWITKEEAEQRLSDLDELISAESWILILTTILFVLFC